MAKKSMVVKSKRPPIGYSSITDVICVAGPVPTCAGLVCVVFVSVGWLLPVRFLG